MSEPDNVKSASVQAGVPKPNIINQVEAKAESGIISFVKHNALAVGIAVAVLVVIVLFVVL